MGYSGSNGGSIGAAQAAAGTMSPSVINSSDTDSGIVFVTNKETTILVDGVAKMAIGTTALTDSNFQYVWNNTSTGSYGAGADTGVGRTAAAVIKVTDGGASNLGFLQTAGKLRSTADVTNATTTFATLTGLLTPTNLLAGRTYSGRLVVFFSDSTAADGAKFDFNAGTATITDFRAHGQIFDTTAAVLASQSSTTLAGVFNAATTTGASKLVVDFTVTINAAGTFGVRQAQNAHTTGTLTCQRGSVLLFDDLV